MVVRTYAPKISFIQNQMKERFTIVIPPPNVMGVFACSSMLNNTIQDLLGRAWLLEKMPVGLGTDHASIAGRLKLFRRLAKQGINKSDLTREEFMKHAWKWTDEYGGTILKQLKRLRASAIGKRTRFTLEEDLSK